MGTRVAIAAALLAAAAAALVFLGSDGSKEPEHAQPGANAAAHVGDVEEVFRAHLEAERACDIDRAETLITTRSREIMRYSCRRMAEEERCYRNKTSDDYRVLTRGDEAILHFDSFSEAEGWPYFFKREGGVWKIDYHKMAGGIAMKEGGCAGGWSWRNDEIVADFCSYFPPGACPSRAAAISR